MFGSRSVTFALVALLLASSPGTGANARDITRKVLHFVFVAAFLFADEAVVKHQHASPLGLVKSGSL